MVQDRRLQLHEILVELVGEEWTVYFQPPSNITMTYPCIRYERDSAETQFAGNRPYRYTKRYQVMVIDKDPDSLIPDKIAGLPMCVFDRHYKVDKLNHDVFNLYF